MAHKEQVFVSGVKPTGAPHMGNYVGAMQRFVELQERFSGFVFVANYHAFTTLQNPEQLSTYSLNVAMDYLAIGLDPERTVLYIQSDVPEVTELAWIFNCLVSMPYLKRGHAFKDAATKEKDINIGVFDYPVLMAADILIHGAQYVPVGRDQKQHLEIAQDIARKFNNAFGETFTVPESLIEEGRDVIPGTDGRKMSKSYGNTIPLFASDDELKKAVMSIVTDSKTPEEPKDPNACTVFALHRVFSAGDVPELERRYREGGIGYHESKEILFENLRTQIAPLRERRQALSENSGEVKRILKNGGEIARAHARVLLTEARKRAGLHV